MSLRHPECQDQPLIRHNPCAIYEEQGTGSHPVRDILRPGPVVVEGERRKNMGVVNAVSPPRGSLQLRNQIGVMGFSALYWSNSSPALNRRTI